MSICLEWTEKKGLKNWVLKITSNKKNGFKK